MCTKAVSVNARQMSDQLQTNVIISNHEGLSKEAAMERINNSDVLPTGMYPVTSRLKL